MIAQAYPLAMPTRRTLYNGRILGTAGSMATSFFEQPILNSPYAAPRRHWELDANRLPTDGQIAQRREASFVSPVPEPKKQRGRRRLEFDAAAAALASESQRYETAQTVNAVRQQVAAWRELPQAQWSVTPETRTPGPPFTATPPALLRSRSPAASR